MVAHADSHDQRIVVEFTIAQDYLVVGYIEIDHFAKQHTRVLLLLKDIAQRSCYVGRRQCAGGHLIEQRLEQVVGGLRDHGDLDVGATKRLRAEQAAKARPDHDYSM